MDRIIIITIIAAALICLLPIQKLQTLKTVLAVLVASAVVGVFGGQVIDHFLMRSESGNGIPVEIVSTGESNALAQGSEIWIQEVRLDDQSYRPVDFFPNAQWLRDDNALGWRSYNRSETLSDRVGTTISGGTDITIVFRSNRWAGIADLIVGSEVKSVDCYTASETNGELPVSVHLNTGTIAENRIAPTKTQWIVFSFAGIAFSLVAYFGAKKKRSTAGVDAQNRSHSVWIDLLKIISIVFIVIIHRAGSFYWQFGDSLSWYNQLFTESLSRFALPCFMFISGYLAISRESSDRRAFQKALRMCVLYLLWSLLYVVFEYYLGSARLKDLLLTIPFGRSQVHLWYAYELVAFYLVLPFIWKVRQSVPRKYLWGFVGVTLILPSVVDTILRLINPTAGNMLVVGWSQFGLNELSLFLLGWLIIDFSEKKQVPPYLYFLGACIGFACTVLMSYFSSKATGGGYNEFFYQGRLPATLFGISVFLLFHSLEPAFQKLPMRVKAGLAGTSSIVMGVYFIHVLVIKMLARISINGLSGAIFSVLLSFAICIIAVQIPVIRKLVQ
ncbi:MAG: acyltransferase [Eubacteriales bacterium]|nr:acyltransferase [Eubacteriales bacterium]